jgi:hypothetical protein
MHKDCPENPKRRDTTWEEMVIKMLNNLARDDVKEEEHAKKIIRNNGRT